MDPPDREGQYVRHYETHRTPSARGLGLHKMVLDCPDKNVMEHRWRTAFYKVPGSHVSVTGYKVDGRGEPCATTEENGITTAADAYYSEEKVLSLAAHSGLPIDYAVTWDGHLVDLSRTSVSYRIREDDVIQAVCAPKVCGGQHRPRQLRQMVEAIVQFRDEQGRGALPDDGGTEPATRSPAHSYAATMLAARAATSTEEMQSAIFAGGREKKRKVRP